jgi:hypothetical protein
MAGLRFSALVAAAFMLFTASADAHGFHAAFTVVEADAKTGALHVVHRMFTQDVDALIKARTNAAVTARSGLAFDAALESYLRTAFTLRDDVGADLPLTWSRVTVADDLVVAYFDVPGTAPKRLIVDSQLLMETNPDQVNTVNVTVNGDTQTAVFRDGDPPHLLTF